jgi:hypothetical protein
MRAKSLLATAVCVVAVAGRPIAHMGQPFSLLIATLG